MCTRVCPCTCALGLINNKLIAPVPREYHSRAPYEMSPRHHASAARAPTPSLSSITSAKRLKILTHTPNRSNIRACRCGGDGQRVPSHHGTVRGVCRRSLWRVNHLRPAPRPCRKKVNFWTLRKSNGLLKMAPPLVVSTCLTPWQHGGGVGTSTDSVTEMSI